MTETTSNQNISLDKFLSIMRLPFRIFRKINYLLIFYYKTYVIHDPFQLAVNQWFKDRGDDTRRLDYPLDKSSVVFDLGGYKGDFAAAIHERYKCKVYVFEPVMDFYQICVKRFEGNSKITCFPFGLSSTEGEFFISNEDNGSSVVNGKALESGERVKIKKITDFIKNEGIKRIDLIKINIEGGEYDVLPCLIEGEMMKNIGFLQVQFHHFIPGAEKKRDEIRAALENTHHESWNYKFVWESWKNKDI